MKSQPAPGFGHSHYGLRWSHEAGLRLAASISLIKYAFRRYFLPKSDVRLKAIAAAMGDKALVGDL